MKHIIARSTSDSARNCKKQISTQKKLHSHTNFHHRYKTINKYVQITIILLNFVIH